ncbi:MAG: hypothetical protein WC700_02030 [Gemmatimonadaceae bacterium]|jgi:hypothetical protein
MSQRAPAIQLQHPLRRGVYEAPYYDASGAVLLVAVTHQHKLLSQRRVRTEAEYGAILTQLERELDTEDPVRLRLEG